MIDREGFYISSERRWILQQFRHGCVPFCYHDHMDPHPLKYAHLLNRLSIWQQMATKILILRR